MRLPIEPLLTEKKVTDKDGHTRYLLIGADSKPKLNKYVGEKATVIINQAGKIITTWARSSAGTRVP